MNSQPAPPPPPPPKPAPAASRWPQARRSAWSSRTSWIGTSSAASRSRSRSCPAKPLETVRLLQMREAVAAHTHAEGDELIYVVAGEGSARLGDEVVALKPSSLVVVPRGLSHQLERRGKNPLIVMSTLTASRARRVRTEIVALVHRGHGSAASHSGRRSWRLPRPPRRSQRQCSGSASRPDARGVSVRPACEMLVYVRFCSPVVSVNVWLSATWLRSNGRRRSILTRVAGRILGVARRDDERQPARIAVGVGQLNRRNRSPGYLGWKHAVMPLRAPGRERGVGDCDI